MNLHLNLHLIGKQGQKHKFSNVTAIFSGANIKCQERYSCLSNNSLIPLRIIRPAQILVHNAIRSTCLFATRTHPPLLSPFLLYKLAEQHVQILAANWIRHSVDGSLINPFQFSLKYWRVCARPAHFGRAPWNCEISAISRSNRWSLFLLINGKGAVYPMYSTNLSKNLSSFASESSLCSRTNFLISYLIGKISGTRQKMRWTSSYDLIFLRLEFQYWQTFRDFVFELILIWFDFIFVVFFFLFFEFDSIYFLDFLLWQTVWDGCCFAIQSSDWFSWVLDFIWFCFDECRYGTRERILEREKWISHNGYQRGNNDDGNWSLNRT